MRVEILLCDPVKAGSSELLQRTLSAAEQRRAARFYFDVDRSVFVASHAALRLALSAVTGIDGRALEFVAGPFGKPALSPKHVCSPVSFNLSHTRGLGAVAVATGTRGRVGVDVEQVIPGTASLDTAATFFSPDEVSALVALGPSQRVDRFFALWTLKESYLKARGEGLSLPLDACAFAFTPQGLEIRFGSALRDDVSRWSFALYRPTGGHLLAVCAETDGQPLVVELASLEPGGLFTSCDHEALVST